MTLAMRRSAVRSDIEGDARRIYEVLREGGLALASTETGYGLIAMGGDAVRRIYDLKGRPAEKPCVTVGALPILDDVAVGIDRATRSWLEAAFERWPLAVVASINPSSRLIASFEPFVAAQCTKGGTIATFHGVGALIARVAELAFDDGRLVVGSSANRTGTGNNYALVDVPASIRSAVDLEIDDGGARPATDGKLASTILDLKSGTFLRKGVRFAEVEESWRSFSRRVAGSRVLPGGA